MGSVACSPCSSQSDKTQHVPPLLGLTTRCTFSHAFRGLKERGEGREMRHGKGVAIGDVVVDNRIS